MPVAAKVEQDGPRDAVALGLERLVYRASHRVVGFRRRQDALGAGELQARLEAAYLMIPMTWVNS
jgi:hypothetical protein